MKRDCLRFTETIGGAEWQLVLERSEEARTEEKKRDAEAIEFFFFLIIDLYHFARS